MRARRRVVLFGASIVLAGLEASLREADGLETLRLRTGAPGAEARLEEFAPEVVVLDLVAGWGEEARCFLLRHPEIPVVSVDITTSTAIVPPGCRSPIPSVADLARVLLMQSAGSGT